VRLNKMESQVLMALMKEMVNIDRMDASVPQLGEIVVQVKKGTPDTNSNCRRPEIEGRDSVRPYLEYGKQKVTITIISQLEEEKWKDCGGR